MQGCSVPKKAFGIKNINTAEKMRRMKKAKMILEQPIAWILIIIFGLLIAWGIYKLINIATERGLPAIFGG